MLQRFKQRRAAKRELMAKLENLTDPTLITRMWRDHIGLHPMCKCIYKIGVKK